MDISESELLYLYRQGDQVAMEILLQKCMPIIGNLIRSINYDIGKYGIEIDDLVQVSIIAFYKSIHSYREDMECSFRTFLSTCVQRDLQTELRSKSSSKHRYLYDSVSLNRMIANEEDSTYETVFCSDKENPHDLLIEKELEKELLYHDNLSSFEREVLQLKVHGYTNKEIAEKLRRNEKSILNAVSRAKTKIGYD